MNFPGFLKENFLMILSRKKRACSMRIFSVLHALYFVKSERR